MKRFVFTLTCCLAVVLLNCCDSSVNENAWAYNESSYTVNFHITNKVGNDFYTLPSGEKLLLPMKHPKTEILNDIPVNNINLYNAVYFRDKPITEIIFINNTDKNATCSTSDKYNKTIEVKANETKNVSLYGIKFEFKSLTDGVGLYYDESAQKVLLF